MPVWRKRRHVKFQYDHSVRFGVTNKREGWKHHRAPPVKRGLIYTWHFFTIPFLYCMWSPNSPDLWCADVHIPGSRMTWSNGSNSIWQWQPIMAPSSDNHGTRQTWDLQPGCLRGGGAKVGPPKGFALNASGDISPYSVHIRELA